jgi:ASC-1-like (ASCH) protein
MNPVTGAIFVLIIVLLLIAALILAGATRITGAAGGAAGGAARRGASVPPELYRGQMFTLHVRAPWLEEIAAGRKTIEGRAGPASKFERLIGAPIILFSEQRQIIVTVTAVRHYPDLYSFIDGEGFKKTSPHLSSREETIAAYHEFYPDELVAERGGMCALQIRYEREGDGRGEPKTRSKAGMSPGELA